MHINFGLLLVGLAFLLAGVFLYKKQKNSEINNTESTKSMVVDYETKIHHNVGNEADTVIYYPIVRYEVNGNTYVEKVETGTNVKKYDIGDVLEIMYNPNKPEEFIIKGDMTSTIMSIICMILGAGVIILTFVG